MNRSFLVFLLLLVACEQHHHTYEPPPRPSIIVQAAPIPMPQQTPVYTTPQPQVQQVNIPAPTMEVPPVFTTTGTEYQVQSPPPASFGDILTSISCTPPDMLIPRDWFYNGFGYTARPARCMRVPRGYIYMSGVYNNGLWVPGHVQPSGARINYTVIKNVKESAPLPKVDTNLKVPEPVAGTVKTVSVPVGGKLEPVYTPPKKESVYAPPPQVNKPDVISGPGTIPAAVQPTVYKAPVATTAGNTYQPRPIPVPAPRPVYTAPPVSSENTYRPMPVSTPSIPPRASGGYTPPKPSTSYSAPPRSTTSRK